MPEGARCPLAVVVPVYRNAETLEPLALRVHTTVFGPAPGYRLLFVVDASPDDSAMVVRRIAGRNPNCSGLELRANVGQHRAILAGLAHIEADYYAVLDADLQDPPELLAELLEMARRRDSTVFAAREGRYQSWHRMMTSWAFKSLLGWLVGLPVNAGTYLLVPHRVAAAMLRMDARSPQVVVMARHFSERYCSLPYRRQLRAQGASAYSPAGRLRAAWRALRCAWECIRQPGAR